MIEYLFCDARKLAGGAVTPIFFVSCVTFCLSLFSISVAGDLQLPDIKNVILSRSPFYTLHRDNTILFLLSSNPGTIPLKKKFHANESLMAEILIAKRHLQITYDQ